jgi:hypothetical protein
MMIGALQRLVRERQITIHDGGTLDEMLAFGQERTESGLTTRLRAENNMNDDMVIALALISYVAVTYPHAMVPAAKKQQESARFWSTIRSNLASRDAESIYD